MLLVLVGCSGFIACDQPFNNPAAPSATASSAAAEGLPPAGGTRLISAHVRSITEDAIDAVIVTDTSVTNVLITNAATGIGQIVVDGKVVCLVDCNDAETVRPAVVPLIAAALTVYGVYDFIRGCAAPAFSLILRNRDLPQSLLVTCVVDGAAYVAAGPVGKYLKHVGVTRLRNVIEDAVGSRITWQQLRSALNKRTFSGIIDVIQAISEELFQPIYQAIYNALRQL